MIPLHYHFHMLTDKARLHAFKSAIESIVKIGDLVADLGSGTGVMAYYAAQSGGVVKGIEFNPELVNRSRELLKNNGVDDKVEIINSDAMKWMSDEPVDVVICEMLHSALLREKQVEVITKFRDLHLEKFGKLPIFIPSGTLLAVQPIRQNYDYFGYDAPVPLFLDPYLDSDGLVDCAEPVLYKLINYDNVSMEKIIAELTIEFDQTTEVNALKFITKNVFGTSLKVMEDNNWHNQYLVLPLTQSMQVESGSKLEISFEYDPGDSINKLQNSLTVTCID